MNLKYSISYFCTIGALSLMLIVAYNYNYNSGYDSYFAEGTPIEDESINSNSNEVISGGFYLRQKGDYVIVLLYDNQTVFDETDILMSTLDLNLQKEIIGGKYIETTKELYGFLENYSS